MATKTLLSLAEFERLPDDGRKHELDEGELVSMTFPNLRHTLIQQRVNAALSRFAESRGVGTVISEGGFLLGQDPPTARSPDVAFVCAERMKAADLDAFFDGAPDLAVEIVSPNDTATQLRRKIRQYLEAGARIVWVLYPDTREAHVFEAGGGDVRILQEKDSLEAPDVLPGFAVQVSELFNV